MHQRPASTISRRRKLLVTAGTHRWRSVRSLVLVLLVLASIGCSDDPAGSGTAGTISGRAVDAQGKGIGGVTVDMTTATSGGAVTAATATTASDGGYTVTLPDGLYGLLAKHEVLYNDRTYLFFLSPDDGIDGDRVHESRDGYVKNFTWKISGSWPGIGHNPDQPHHYGGSINLTNEHWYNHRNVNGLPDPPPFAMGSTINITLVPTGPMIDGSQGSEVVRHIPIVAAEWANATNHLPDIPLGRYTATATLTAPDGSVANLRVATVPIYYSPIETSPIATSGTVEFWPLGGRNTGTHVPTIFLFR